MKRMMITRSGHDALHLTRNSLSSPLTPFYARFLSAPHLLPLFAMAFLEHLRFKPPIHKEPCYAHTSVVLVLVLMLFFQGDLLRFEKTGIRLFEESGSIYL